MTKGINTKANKDSRFMKMEIKLLSSKKNGIKNKNRYKMNIIPGIKYDPKYIATKNTK